MRWSGFAPTDMSRNRVPDREAVALFVAAEVREFKGLLRFCKRMGRLDWPVDWARSAELNGNRIVMVANGAGAERAARAVDVAAAAGRISSVVNIGFCGALDRALGVGDIFVASRIQGSETPLATPFSPRPYRKGVLASINRVARTEEEKRTLAGAGASAVEMEAAGVAARARAYALPLYCVRSVTDLAQENLANDLNAALRPDGHFDTFCLLKNAMKRPAVLLPELIRLRNRSAEASRKLGEFVADCRF